MVNRSIISAGYVLVATLFCCFGYSDAGESAAYSDLVRIVEVALSQPSDVDILSNAGMVVSNVDNNRATLYVFEEQLPQLYALGFTPVPIKNPIPEPKHLTAYHTFETMTADLQAFAAAHPDIVRMVSVGKSASNRDLWALLITDNPDEEEDEPEFRYISTLHGDEKIGTELCLYLIDKLLDEYGTTPRITNLINDTEIWILPLANPDGWVAHQRFNAFGVDLNRNFPDFPGDFTGTLFNEALDVSNKQVEVQHIAAWSAEQSFVLSANFHSGALVVNYPYDFSPGIPSGTPAIAPDDALLAAMATEYAIHNAPMLNNPSFPGGTTNGSDWFAITGGMQDWHYRYLGCIDMTIELSNIKTPASNTIPQFWTENEEAMLSYMEEIHQGVRGIVADRNTGDPLWTQVNVNTNTQPVFSDPDVGDYYRLLLPGTYNFLFFATGYIPYAVENIEVIADAAATRLDVTLSDGDLNGDGVVNAVDVQLSVNALLGFVVGVDADVDGLGLSATDLQHVINKSLGIG